MKQISSGFNTRGKLLIGYFVIAFVVLRISQGAISTGPMMLIGTGGIGAVLAYLVMTLAKNVVAQTAAAPNSRICRLSGAAELHR